MSGIRHIFEVFSFYTELESLIVSISSWLLDICIFIILKYEKIFILAQKHINRATLAFR